MVLIIEIDLYTKPTAEHQYLLRLSCRPLHTKQAFSFSLALRIRCICSSDETYNLGLLNQEIQSVHTITYTHTSDSPTPIDPSSCRIPPSHSLNIIYFPQAHFTFSHPPNFVPLCLNLYYYYYYTITFLRTNKPEIR